MINKIGIGTGHLHNISQLKYVEYAISLGANFIDTAESYCDGTSEKLLSKVIEGKRGNLFISTKVSPENLNNIKESCENSLRRLGVDYIDLYSVHWPNPKVSNERIIEQLLKLQEQGKIKYLGLSNYSLQEILNFDLSPFAFHREYNLLNLRDEEAFFSYCCISGKLLIAYSPLDQGNLNNFKFLIKFSKKYGKSISQIILNFISCSAILLIPESYNLQHIKENHESFNFYLSQKDFTEIYKNLPHTFLIRASEIAVISKGRENRKAYKNIKEAQENSLNFTPSPLELSHSLKRSDFIKPVKLNKNLELVEGRLRFWAQVLAFGEDTLIRSIIVRN